jgi:hypothetical protein
MREYFLHDILVIDGMILGIILEIIEYFENLETDDLIVHMIFIVIVVFND